MRTKNLLRTAPVALMLVFLTVPAGDAAQGVGTHAEAVCTATTATAEASSTMVVPSPGSYPLINAAAGGSAVTGETLYVSGPVGPSAYYMWAQYAGTYVQATWASAKTANELGTVAADCEFDPFGVIEFPAEPDVLQELEGIIAGCRALPDDPVRHLEGRVGFDALGVLWVAGADFAHPLTGTLSAGTASQEAPSLAWTGGVFEADFGPDGCSVLIG